ncbi:hypothetical protein T492DRAFT_850753 [Pavlovales sp. CCMP2436]|nr:hypothetical protein T492DRAFT_850753 [Pavlovales sp. CCMP2436]
MPTMPPTTGKSAGGCSLRRRLLAMTANELLADTDCHMLPPFNSTVDQIPRVTHWLPCCAAAPHISLADGQQRRLRDRQNRFVAASRNGLRERRTVTAKLNAAGESQGGVASLEDTASPGGTWSETGKGRSGSGPRGRAAGFGPGPVRGVIAKLGETVTVWPSAATEFKDDGGGIADGSTQTIVRLIRECPDYSGPGWRRASHPPKPRELIDFQIPYTGLPPGLPNSGAGPVRETGRLQPPPTHPPTTPGGLSDKDPYVLHQS